jgi:helix-turn-helix protein
MLYPPVALERAMTIREVVLRAMSGEITWIQAAEIIGCTPRSVRRWRGRFMLDGLCLPLIRPTTHAACRTYS